MGVVTSDWPVSAIFCLQYLPGVAASNHWVFLSATEVWGKRAQTSHSSPGRQQPTAGNHKLLPSATVSGEVSHRHMRQY
jgi:hypothetical protein